MNLTFEALEAALAPIESVGQGESTFDVGGTSVTLRVIRPDEEIEVQKFASIPSQTVGDGEETPPEETTTVALEYIERFKVGLLAYALAKLDEPLSKWKKIAPSYGKMILELMNQCGT